MRLLLLIAFGLVASLAEESHVLKEFAVENIQFIGELYEELLKIHIGNFLVCPLSIQSLLALVNEGARGNTSRQITKTLHLPEDEDKVREIFLGLAGSLQNTGNYTSSSANKIYVANNFSISEQYQKAAVEVFAAEIQNVDFAETQQAVAEVNKWVEEKTFGKITDLLNEDAISADTVALLINALYFQGRWVKQFKSVGMLPFYLSKKRAIYTSMMNVYDSFNYYESPTLGAKFLEMPYEGGDVSMTFVLPKKVGGLPALETRIADVLVAPKYSLESVEVFIPKFKIETSTHFVPVLRNLGITDAFSDLADFSGIGENQNSFTISDVIQKSFIEVDEKGTTAAAASFVLFDRAGYQQDFSFIADHPFLFYLKHRVNGIFFIGRYSVPEWENT